VRARRSVRAQSGCVAFASRRIHRVAVTAWISRVTVWVHRAAAWVRRAAAWVHRVAALQWMLPHRKQEEEAARVRVRVRVRVRLP
jgi:hypothetical protein